MRTWRVWLAGVLLTACATKANPDATCANGTCNDPNFPVCDVDGTLGGGAPGTCIAVTCTAGAFHACKDNGTSLVCNAAGDNYDATTCANGCDTTLGCRACAANQTTCANGITETCDAAGNISGSETCALGCSDDATRCKVLVPSNNLGMFFGMMPDPQDLTLMGTLDLKNGKLTTSGVTTTIPSFDVPAVAGGSPIRVFVGKHVVLGDLTVLDSTIALNGAGVGRAFAVLATSDLEVTGRVQLATGAINTVGCTGGAGNIVANYIGGAGGGGHASAGGNGGAVPAQTGSGSAGTMSGTDSLTPLRGGCPGGGSGTLIPIGGNGGGAIQLVSQTLVNVTGTIVVDGSAFVGPVQPTVGGGGGGGALVEAPVVTFAPSAKVLARGGAGTALGHVAPTPLDDMSAPPGASCAAGDIRCGDGGSGAAPGSVAMPGGDTGTPITNDTQGYAAGSGGGGLGRIRINTSDANFGTSASVIVAGALTAGTVGSN